MAKHTVSPAKFGMTWVEGNEWIEIGVLNAEGHVDEEIAVLMQKASGIQERHAKIIVDALNEFFENHGLAEGFLWAG